MTLELECISCRDRGKGWVGSGPRCAFPQGIFSSDNWNCATANKIRDIIDKWWDIIPKIVDYQYCNDEHYGIINISGIEGLSDGPLALWVAWYKDRGKTDAMWLLFEDKPPCLPTIEECEAIIAWFARKTQVI